MPFTTPTPVTSSNVTVSGAVVVSAAETANNFVVSSGGDLIVESGGITNAATIYASGNLIDGGTANSTVVTAGGTLSDANGIMTNTFVEVLGVVSNQYGSGTGDTVNAFGTLQVVGGLETNDTILAEGIVYNAGTTVNLSNTGGYEFVSKGLDSSGSVTNGGSVYVMNGGTTVAETLAAGTFEFVSSGGLASSTLLNIGATLVVSSGGQAVGTEVFAGDTLILSSGASLTGTVFNSAAAFYHSAGMAVQSSVIDGGAQEDLLSGAVESGISVSSGGTLYVWSGASAVKPVVSSGGTLTVSAGGTVTSAVVSSGGMIDLTAVTFSSGATASYNSSTHVLTISEGGSTISQTLATNEPYKGYITVGNDGLGGTLLTFACFAEGTTIRTTRGDVAVEDLRAGDRAASAFGGSSEIVWTGHRTVDGTRHPSPVDVMPIRIRAGAFNTGMPARDLLVSPDHAIFVDVAGDGGVLIPARYLVNDTTIVQEVAERITYWHVECEQHDIILAEGLACETYLDTGNRNAFVESTAPTLQPDFSIGARAIWDLYACRPLVESGAALDTARALLAQRAAILGFDVPSFQRVDVDHRGLVRAVVQPGTARVHLVSPCRVPEGDRRRLGVTVEAITLDGVALDEANLVTGFHAEEASPDGSYRWTDGEAVLALSPSDRPRVLAITVGRVVPGLRKAG